MAYLFQTILDRGKKRFERARNTYDMPTTKDVRDWYRSIIRTTGKEAKVDPDAVISQSDELGKTISRFDAEVIGKMLFFNYDPKHKETLPYYDNFPLVFPIEIYEDGFLGINLHYLAPYFRAMLMDALYTASTDKNYDKDTKLKISYRILADAYRYRYFKPTVKRYLWSHVRSNFVLVEPKYWDMALMLPLARFQKMSETEVFAESLKQVDSKK